MYGLSLQPFVAAIWIEDMQMVRRIGPMTTWKIQDINDFLAPDIRGNQKVISDYIESTISGLPTERTDVLAAFSRTFNINVLWNLALIAEKNLVFPNTFIIFHIIEKVLKRGYAPGYDMPNKPFDLPRDLIIKLALNPFAEIKISDFMFGILPLLVGFDMAATFPNTAKLLTLAAPGFCFPEEFLHVDTVKKVTSLEEHQPIYNHPGVINLNNLNSLGDARMQRLSLKNGKVKTTPIERGTIAATNLGTIITHTITIGWYAFEDPFIRMTFQYEALLYLQKTMFIKNQTDFSEETDYLQTSSSFIKPPVTLRKMSFI